MCSVIYKDISLHFVSVMSMPIYKYIVEITPDLRWERDGEFEDWNESNAIDRIEPTYIKYDMESIGWPPVFDGNILSLGQFNDVFDTAPKPAFDMVSEGRYDDWRNQSLNKNTSERCIFVTKRTLDGVRTLIGDPYRIISFGDYLKLREELEEIPELLNINTNDPFLLFKGSTIAIVFNSSCVVNKKHGQAIDNHDIVVRFNLGNVHNQYKEDLGEKTSIRIVNKSTATTQLIIDPINNRLNYEQMKHIGSTKLVIWEATLARYTSILYGVDVYIKNFGMRSVINPLCDEGINMKYTCILEPSLLRERRSKQLGELNPTSGFVYLCLLTKYFGPALSKVLTNGSNRNPLDIYGVDLEEDMTEYNYIEIDGTIVALSTRYSIKDYGKGCPTKNNQIEDISIIETQCKGKKFESSHYDHSVMKQMFEAGIINITIVK